MECVKQFSLTVDAADCPLFVQNYTIPSPPLGNNKGILSLGDGALMIAPDVPATEIWRMDDDGGAFASNALPADYENIRWIEYIPSLNVFHAAVYHVPSNQYHVQVVDSALTMGIQINPGGGGGVSAISFVASINRSFMFTDSSTLVEFNGNAVDRQINIGIDTFRVDYSNAKLYCPDYTVGTKVRVIDYVTGATVTDIVTPARPAGWATVVGNKVFGWLSGSPATLFVIDAVTDTLTGTISVDAGFPNGNSGQIAYSSSTGLIYCNTTLGQYAIDPVTETIVCQYDNAINLIPDEFGIGALVLPPNTGINVIFLPVPFTQTIMKFTL